MGQLLRACVPSADAAPLARLDAELADVLGASGPRWHDTVAADPGRAHLVLDDGGEPAGYLVLAAPRGPEPGIELHRLVVAADRRGRGLGRALLRTALALAAVPQPPAGLDPDPAWIRPDWLPAGRLWLEAHPANSAAVHLYRSEGLLTEARLPSVPGDPSSPARRLVLARG
ncbi:GNAT family N-acetyltransferase [Pseudonocardia sp. NPDC046786]|uniref:GNAT family N-acetyltransferase n=1 Tax=Pseudonocardia sp. NPDC046786 TaxID=3155471 RepID=UPI003402524B